MASQAKKRKRTASESRTEVQCDTCNKLIKDLNAKIMDQDLVTMVAGQQRKKFVKEKLEPFYKAVNAALNQKEEKAICIHTENPHFLGEFDKKVDDKLTSLIPDDSFFEENFERYFYDRQHVVFKVTKRDRPLSTLDFSTKVSLNKGLTDPSHIQMKRFVQKIHSENNSEQRPPPEIKLVLSKNAEVKVSSDIDKELLPFQESVRVQAKPAKDTYRAGNTNPNQNRIDKQLQLWWNEQDLPEFISAFAKLPYGGSIFLGVREKVERGQQTGIFMCQGLICNPSEQEEMREKLLNMISEKMVWSSRSNIDPKTVVNVVFHNVSNGAENECVMEVTVRYFHGICFVGEGPECFVLQHSNNNEMAVQKVPLATWMDKVRNVSNN